MPLLLRLAVCLLGALCAIGVCAQPAASAALAAPDPAALVARAELATRRDPQDAARLAAEALQALLLRPDPDQEMRARRVRCEYEVERDIAAAQREISAMRALVPRLTRPGLRVGQIICEGELHESQSQNLQAMALYRQAVAVAETAADDEFLADALVQRGYLRGVQGEFAQGLADLQRAKSIYERLDKPIHLMTTMNGVAILYNRMGDHEQARHYYEESLKSQRADGFLREQVVTQYNLGTTLERMNRWADARRAFEGALALSRQMDYRRGEVYALRGLASVRNADAQPALALILLDTATQLQDSIPDERLRAQILLQRGIALRQLKRFGEALAPLRESLKVFLKADSTAEAQQAAEQLALSAAALGDWRSAYEHQGQAQKLSESLLRRQLDDRFATLKVQFDTAGKDKENALLQREKVASERALQEQRRAGRLQALAVGLASALALLLGLLAWRHRRTSVRMQGLAMTDELTGLPNRRQVLGLLERLLGATGVPCAALIADLDHFKAINDAHGHEVGDEILRLVAGVLRSLSDVNTHVGRVGGEEFVLVLPGADLEQAMRVAEQLRERVAAMDVSRWIGALPLTTSIGIAISQAGDSVGSMLRRADEALYEAKRSGRNRIVGRPSAA